MLKVSMSHVDGEERCQSQFDWTPIVVWLHHNTSTLIVIFLYMVKVS